jgi:hypothetical protein
MGESRMQRKLPVRFGGGWAETDARKRARRRPSTLRHASPGGRCQPTPDPGLARPQLTDTTTSRYSHLTRSAEQRASQTLDELLSGLLDGLL